MNLQKIYICYGLSLYMRNLNEFILTLILGI